VRSLAPLLLCLALAGCHRDIQNEDAVKRGVMDYLSTRQGLNLSSMSVSVTSLVYRQNEVDATVVFSPKGSDAAQPMTLRYLLERKGDRWVVKPRATSGNPHGGMGASPHGGMGMPPAGGASGTLPPGHPTVPPQ
jgi:hypothetical protein